MAFLQSFSINTGKQHPFPFNIPAVRFGRQLTMGEKVTIFVEDFSTFIDDADREREKIAMELLDLKGKVDDSVIHFFARRARGSVIAFKRRSSSSPRILPS